MKLGLRFHGHLTDAEIVDFVDHDPDSKISETRRTHAHSCPTCRSRLEAHQNLLGILTRPWSDAMIQGQLPHSRSRSLARAGLGLAALTALVVGALTVSGLAHQTASSLTPPPTNYVSSPDGTSPASPTPTTASPQVISTGGGECPEGDTVALQAPPRGAASLVSVPVPDQLASIRWAPDGRHFLLAGNRVDVFDSDGSLVRSTADAGIGTWLENTTYATGLVCGGSLVGTTVTVHGLDGSSKTLPRRYDSTSTLGSGHALLALAPMGQPGNDPTTTIIWNGSTLSAPLSGRPLAWSPDGSMLLVTKGSLQGGSTGGQALIGVSLLSAPDMSIHVSLGELRIDPRYSVVFSSDGHSIALPCALLSSGGLCSPMVLDTQTGGAAKVTDWMPASPLSWLPNGHLLVGPAPDGDHAFQEWSPAGLKPSTVGAAGWANASTQGGIVTGTAPAGEGGTTRVDWTNGAASTNLPSARDAYWSPDGSRVLLDPGAGGNLLLVVR